MSVIIAIDPGAVSGAYACHSSRGITLVGDIPVVDGQVDGATFARLLRDFICPDVAIVERVGAMPKQGVASTFKFGKAVGIIEGVLASASIPLHYVSPQVWKKHFKLVGSDKERSRALAIQRHPGVTGLHLKKHHGRAEALLMLDWYRTLPKATTGEDL